MENFSFLFPSDFIFEPTGYLGVANSYTLLRSHTTFQRASDVKMYGGEKGGNAILWEKRATQLLCNWNKHNVRTFSAGLDNRDMTTYGKSTACSGSGVDTATTMATPWSSSLSSWTVCSAGTLVVLVGDLQDKSDYYIATSGMHSNNFHASWIGNEVATCVGILRYDLPPPPPLPPPSPPSHCSDRSRPDDH